MGAARPLPLRAASESQSGDAVLLRTQVLLDGRQPLHMPRGPLCGGYAQYHVYEEVCRSKFDPDYTTWVAFDGNNACRDPDIEDRQYGSHFLEGWMPLPVLDERFTNMDEGAEVPFMTTAFVYARDSLLKLAMKRYDIMFDLQEARAEREYIRDHLGSTSPLLLYGSARDGVDKQEKDALLSAEICLLEEEFSKTVIEAVPWLLAMFELFRHNEAWIEGLHPW